MGLVGCPRSEPLFSHLPRTCVSPDDVITVQKAGAGRAAQLERGFANLRREEGEPWLVVGVRPVDGAQRSRIRDNEHVFRRRRRELDGLSQITALGRVAGVGEAGGIGERARSQPVYQG